MKLRKNLLLIFISIVFVHVIIEVGLRSAGKIFLFTQEMRNLNQSKEGNTYKILCVGESTTMLGGKNSYPRQLEAILNKKNLSQKFEVINKGMVGTQTDSILFLMEDHLFNYKPDMVIAMMGVNDFAYEPSSLLHVDNHKAFLGKVNSFFRKFRVYKLYSFIYRGARVRLGKDPENNKSRNMAAFELEGGEQKTIYNDGSTPEKYFSDTMTRGKFKYGIVNMLKANYGEAEKVFRHLIDHPSATLYNSKARFYYYLANCLYLQSKVKELAVILKKVPYRNWQGMNLIGFCNDRMNADYIVASLKDLVQEYPYISFYYDMIYQCYERSGNFKEAAGWKQKGLENKQEYFHKKTRENYLKLVNILKKDNERIVLMQYPLREVELLKSIVESNTYYDKIIFVDNKKVFEEAVKKEGFDAIFSDYFAGDFGHCTTRGNYILAQNVSNTLIREMGWK